jgi:hypothetical protein
MPFSFKNGSCRLITDLKRGLLMVDSRFQRLSMGLTFVSEGEDVVMKLSHNTKSGMSRKRAHRTPESPAGRRIARAAFHHYFFRGDGHAPLLR